MVYLTLSICQVPAPHQFSKFSKELITLLDFGRLCKRCYPPRASAIDSVMASYAGSLLFRSPAAIVWYRYVQRAPRFTTRHWHSQSATLIRSMGILCRIIIFTVRHLIKKLVSLSML